MSKKRLVQVQENQPAPKLVKTETRFRVSFETSLDNGFEIKDMKLRNVQDFHRFLSDTVYKGLTISEVDRLYLRKRGLSNAPPLKKGDIELIHYGNDNQKFRLYGYYNKNGYFVICRIDGDHKTHSG